MSLSETFQFKLFQEKINNTKHGLWKKIIQRTAKLEIVKVAKLWSVLEYLSNLKNFLEYRLVYDFSLVIFVDIKLAEGELLQLTKRENTYQCS